MLKLKIQKKTIYNRNVLNCIIVMHSLQAAITILQSDKVITKDSAIGLNFKGFRGWPLLTGAAIDDTISI